jgi:hypothetical protein
LIAPCSTGTRRRTSRSAAGTTSQAHAAHTTRTRTMAPLRRRPLRDPLPLTDERLRRIFVGRNGRYGAGRRRRARHGRRRASDRRRCMQLAGCMHCICADANRCVGEPLKAACLHRRLRQGHARVLHRQQVAAWRGMVSRTAWCATQHGIPYGMVSRAAWHPIRHGIPYGRVSHTA